VSGPSYATATQPYDRRSELLKKVLVEGAAHLKKWQRVHEAFGDLWILPRVGVLMKSKYVPEDFLTPKKKGMGWPDLSILKNREAPGGI